MTPPNPFDPATALGPNGQPVVPPQRQQPSGEVQPAGGGLGDVAATVGDAAGTILEGAGDVVGCTAEGVGAVLGGASGCSLVVLVALFATAGTAVALFS